MSGLLSKNNSNTEYVYIVVDNYNEDLFLEVYGNIHVLSGDNTNWEFSGWQKGLIYIKENIECDLIMFLNDSLRSYKHEILRMKRFEEMLKYSFKK